MMNFFKKLRAQLARDKETMARLDKVKKIEFVWDYYKVPIAILATLVFVLFSLVYAGLTRGNNILYVVMVNASPSASEENAGEKVISEILSEKGFNMDKKKASVEDDYTLDFDSAGDSDIATLQVLSAQFGIGDLDLFVSDKEVFDKFAIKNGFCDLRAYLPREILTANEDKIYYYEKEDGNMVPVGVWLDAGSPLHNEGLYEEPVLAGIVSRAENAETAEAVLESLLIVQN